MIESKKTALVVLGPTAAGKTALGIALARAYGGEVISADSRQVYRGLDIGSGKDLDAYTDEGVTISHHLIDVVNPGHEFSVFEFQRRFFDAYTTLQERNTLPVVVGGTGLYLDAVLRGYAMVEVPENSLLRAELDGQEDDALVERLRGLKGDLHNTTDLEDRPRLVRAIEIATHTQTHEPEPTPHLDALILGIRRERKQLHERIAQRLRERLDGGLIEEVERLQETGVSPETFHFLGLEYRFVYQYLDGAIKNRNDLFQKLNVAIRRFAKRQETWFRRMERQGVNIEWLDNGDPDKAMALATEAFPMDHEN